MLGAMLPLAIRLIGWILDRSSADAQTKAAFVAFVQSAQAAGLVSAKLKESYDSQLDRILAELEAEKKVSP